MRKVTKHYLVDGVDRYVIEFHKQPDGTWKDFCFQHPHNPRSDAVTVCHLFSSGQVCVAAGREPRSLEKAMAIGMFWANGYSKYIRTGVFPNGSTKVNVPG
jgi:hypothetical protein